MDMGRSQRSHLVGFEINSLQQFMQNALAAIGNPFKIENATEKGRPHARLFAMLWLLPHPQPHPLPLCFVLCLLSCLH